MTAETLIKELWDVKGTIPNKKDLLKINGDVTSFLMTKKGLKVSEFIIQSKKYKLLPEKCILSAIEYNRRLIYEINECDRTDAMYRVLITLNDLIYIPDSYITDSVIENATKEVMNIVYLPERYKTNEIYTKFFLNNNSSLCYIPLPLKMELILKHIDKNPDFIHYVYEDDFHLINFDLLKDTLVKHPKSTQKVSKMIGSGKCNISKDQSIWLTSLVVYNDGNLLTYHTINALNLSIYIKKNIKQSYFWTEIVSCTDSFRRNYAMYFPEIRAKQYQIPDTIEEFVKLYPAP